MYGAYCRDGDDFRFTIPVEYTEIKIFGSGNEKLVLAATSDDTFIAFSPQGEKIIDETIQNYYGANSYGLTITLDGTSWGFLAWDGEWILPPEYNWINAWDGGTFTTYQGSEKETMTEIITDPNAQIDWLDHSGKSLLPDGYQISSLSNGVVNHGDYSYLSAEFQNSQEQTLNSEEKNFVLRSDGIFLVQAQYSIQFGQDEMGNIFFFNNNSDGYQSYIDVYDEQGQLLLEHSSVSKAVGNRMFTNLKKDCIITADGEEIEFPQPYDHLTVGGKFVWVETDGEYRPCDWSGNLIADISCDRYTILDDDFDQKVAAYRTTGGKIGVISADGSIQIPAEYEDVMQYYDPAQNALFLKKDGHWGVLSGDGKQMIPFEYERISIASDSGYFFASKDGKVGILDLQGHVVQNFQYDAPPERERTFLDRDLVVQEEFSFMDNLFVIWEKNKCGVIAI